MSDNSGPDTSPTSTSPVASNSPTSLAASSSSAQVQAVQAAKPPAGPDDLEDANVVVKDGADNADDNSLLSHDQEDSESQDPLSRRRRVRIYFSIFSYQV